jgi:tripartite-type tricarboxylate transporter receptor subunit TctC
MIEKLTRRAALGAAVGSLAALAADKARAAAEWPSRTINLVHGFPAGGPSDLIARLLAEGLGKALGQAVIVEPRPGASGTVAAGLVARAAPDGYTLMVIPSGFASAAATFAHLPYRSVEDFTEISLASEYPYLMCTNAASGIKTVAELLNAAKTRATPLLYGTPGIGSGPQLAIELFALKSGVKFQHVPFRGSAPASEELIAGRLDFMMDPPATLIEFVRTGKLNALAVSSSSRYFALPNVPTIAQSGVPGFDVRAWQGLIAPAGLPAPIVSRLNAEVVRLLREPASIERLHAFGNEPAPSTAEAFRKQLIDDIATWTALADQIHFQKI